MQYRLYNFGFSEGIATACKQRPQYAASFVEKRKTDESAQPELTDQRIDIGKSSRIVRMHQSASTQHERSELCNCGPGHVCSSPRQRCTICAGTLLSSGRADHTAR